VQYYILSAWLEIKVEIIINILKLVMKRDKKENTNIRKSLKFNLNSFLERVYDK